MVRDLVSSSVLASLLVRAFVSFLFRVLLTGGDVFVVLKVNCDSLSDGVGDGDAVCGFEEE